MVLRLAEVAIFCESVGDSDDGHSCCVGCEHTIVRVFDDETVFRIEVKLFGSFEIEIGSGFDTRGVASANDGVEVLSEVQFVEPAVDPIM